MILLEGSRNVYVETGYRGANVGFVTTARGIVMIESPMRPSDAVQWRAQIQEKGQILCLIHTEGYHDHVMGDYFFDVPVISHEKSRDAIVASDAGRLKEMIADIDPQGAALAEDYRLNIPAVSFSERLILYIGDHTFQMTSTPGHTAGQTSILIPEERVVFTGDNVNYRSPVFLHEALPDAWLESLRKMGEMDVDHIVPGHGEVCERAYLAEWTKLLEEWFESVREAIRKGWSKEESIQRITPPSGSPKTDDEDFLRMMVRMNVSRLYDLFSAEKLSTD
jgi:cyclase